MSEGSEKDSTQGTNLTVVAIIEKSSPELSDFFTIEFSLLSRQRNQRELSIRISRGPFYTVQHPCIDCWCCAKETLGERDKPEPSVLGTTLLKSNLDIEGVNENGLNLI